jgi:hypothetical protein
MPVRAPLKTQGPGMNLRVTIICSLTFELKSYKRYQFYFTYDTAAKCAVITMNVNKNVPDAAAPEGMR